MYVLYKLEDGQEKNEGRNCTIYAVWFHSLKIHLQSHYLGKIILKT